MLAGMRWFWILFIVAGFICTPFWNSPVRADDVIDSINEAVQYYNENNLVEAANSLDYAAQLIRQKQSTNLQTYLPKALPGWTEEDVSSQAMAPAMFGGMISAEKRYVKDSSTITIKLITESPIIQGLMMMFQNPMLATSDGGKLKKIAGQKAIIKYRSADHEGEINILVDKRILVTIEGSEVSAKDLTEYAAAIDYAKLKEL